MLCLTNSDLVRLSDVRHSLTYNYLTYNYNTDTW